MCVCCCKPSKSHRHRAGHGKHGHGGHRGHHRRGPRSRVDGPGWRCFTSSDERRRALEGYRDELEEELKAVEERLEEL